MVSVSMSLTPFRMYLNPADEAERLTRANKTSWTLNEVKPVFSAKINKGCLTITTPDADEMVALTKRESLAFAKWIRGKVK